MDLNEEIPRMAALGPGYFTDIFTLSHRLREQLEAPWHVGAMQCERGPYTLIECLGREGKEDLMESWDVEDRWRIEDYGF
jgi:hypothetical protein